MLEDILSTKTKMLLLKTLCKDISREYTFCDLTKLVGLSFGTVHPAIKDLAKQRIVLQRKVGRSILYSLNKRHLLASRICGLFEDELREFYSIVKSMVRRLEKKRVKTIILFGSLARGNLTSKSDIDLLILYSGKLKQIRESTEDVISQCHKDYDIIIVPTFLSVEEAKERKKKFDKFILNVLEEGKILYGDIKWLER